MNYRGIKIIELTRLPLALIPVTAGANGSHGHKSNHEDRSYHGEKDLDEDNGYRGGRQTRLKKELSESSCNSIEGRGLYYAYCEVLDCDSGENKDRRIYQGLSRRYGRVTRTNTPPSCTAAIETISQSASCPCFRNLSEAGFTNVAICNNTNGIAQVSEFNGTIFLVAEGGATSTFPGCSLNDAKQLSIPNDEATACVSIIEDFCPPNG